MLHSVKENCSPGTDARWGNFSSAHLNSCKSRDYGDCRLTETFLLLPITDLPVCRAENRPVLCWSISGNRGECGAADALVIT